MPSVVQERIAKVMDEQKAEAPLPTSRAVMDFGEQEVEAPDVNEQTTEEMPLPQTAEGVEQPEPEVDANAAESNDLGEWSNLTADQEEGEAEQKPDPEWSEMNLDLEPEPVVEEPDDPYGRAMADMDWRMTLQQRDQILA